MLTQPPSMTPQQLAPIVREFVADALTPISAYLALATPGRSCLLESVEGTDRIARFSFIGLDYLETATFDDDPDMLERIRALIAAYRLDVPGLPFSGGAVCVFAYDAARVLERIGPKPAAGIDVPDALVVVPGTWVVFDHFTHRVTLIAFARSDDDRSEIERRLDRYIAQLLGRPADDPG